MAEGQQQQQQQANGILASDPIFASWDEETKGAFKNAGWDQKPAAEAAFNAMKSFRETQAFVGAPKDRLVILPKDATDEAGRNALYAKLGVPDDPKKYDFSAIKFSDGSALDQQFIDSIAPALRSAGVSKDRAPEIAQAVVKFLDGSEANISAENTAKLAQERDKLVKDWGPNLESNQFIANQAAAKLGLGNDILEPLAKIAGHAAVAQALLKLGQMMGEDRYIASPASGDKGVMTGGQAQARLTELKGDKTWVAKLNAGDAQANREFNNLTEMIARAA